MVVDKFDVSYGESWGAERHTTHPEPIPREVAARRHAANLPYSVLLAVAERPMVLIEFWTDMGWRIYLFDEGFRRAQMIDFGIYSEGLLWVSQNTQMRYSSDEEPELHPKTVHNIATVSADGHVVAMTAPEFGDWQGFARFLAYQRHELAETLILRDAPVPADGWTGAMRPSGIEELFTAGTGHSSRDMGTGVVEIREIERLRLPSGQLIVTDPCWTSEQPLTITVPPGEYPVSLSLVRWVDHRCSTVAGAKITVVDEAVTRWEMAVLPDQELAVLGAGQFYGCGVDTGMASFVDAAGSPVLNELFDENIDELFKGFDDSFSVELTHPQSGANLVAFRSGWGDGHYPVWIGRAKDGRVASVVVDFLLEHDDPDD